MEKKITQEELTEWIKILKDLNHRVAEEKGHKGKSAPEPRAKSLEERVEEIENRLATLEKAVLKGK